MSNPGAYILLASVSPEEGAYPSPCSRARSKEEKGASVCRLPQVGALKRMRIVKSDKREETSIGLA